MKQHRSSRTLFAFPLVALSLCIALSCNRTDPDYDLLTSQEVKVVVDGGGSGSICPFCGGKILPNRYHHHLSSKSERCPVDSCSLSGANHRHCFYNGTEACPGHERGYGGMGGGSY